MTITGIKKLGFIEQNEVVDIWSPITPPNPQRSGFESVIPGLYYVDFDQGDAVLSENLTEDENGMVYNTTLHFTTRKNLYINLLAKYLKRPVVMHVWTIDGNHFRIGTKDLPVRMRSVNSDDGINVREMKIEVSCQSLSSLLR